MKQKVIKFFQNLPEAPHEQFNKAFALYRESEGKNVMVEKAINARGFSENALSNLLYDLQKLHGITDLEKEGSQKLEVRSEEATSNELIDGAGPAVANTEASVVSTEPSEDLKTVLRQAQDDNETLKLDPKLDAKAIRVEFPFLNEKDCPDELKILVADKITAWNRYLDCHAELLKIESGEIEETDLRKADLAQNAVEAFDENQKIYDELNCYQTTGKILGVHPIFKKLQLTREVEEMTADELIKYKGSSAKYFSVKKTALAKAKKAKDEAKVQEIEAAVAERSEKLFLVNKKLGV